MRTWIVRLLILAGIAWAACALLPVWLLARLLGVDVHDQTDWAFNLFTTKKPPKTVEEEVEDLQRPC